MLNCSSDKNIKTKAREKDAAITDFKINGTKRIVGEEYI